MENNLKSAVIHFLANEFKLQPETVGTDLNFELDLNLTPQEVYALIQRLQEALDFTLPEERINSIQTIEDLLRIIDPDIEIDE